MCFPKPISRINCFLNSSTLNIVLTTLFLWGCSVNRVYDVIPPSNHSVKNLNAIYIFQFKGKKSTLFEKIFQHEIEKHEAFKSLKILPNPSQKNAALLSIEVIRYFVKDVEEIIKQKKIILIEKEIPKKNHLGIDKLNREFDFVEKIYDERVIHRTLNLAFSLKLTNIERNKTLFLDTENASLKLSYLGEENILLIPDSNDEMARLSQSIIKNFLNKINPNPNQILIELEKGTRPLSWTLDLIDFGHPRIIRSNHYATGKEYELALRGWNYVLFEPKTFPESEDYFFSDDVFLRLRKVGLPDSIFKTLFSIRGKSFNLNELNIVLLGLLSSRDYERFSRIIKYHARFDKKIDRTNLASAHFNLGSVYKFQNEFELAAYHFAQANAFNPQEKYSQSWIEVQHLMGDFDPQKESKSSIESFLGIPPPKNALLHPKN